LCPSVKEVITVKSQKRPLQRSEIILLLVLIPLGVLFRLVKISQPFVDAWSWRQADVGMIAENFYLHGFNIFYPQINWAGINPGYVGTEFPFVPFIASLHYAVLGIQDWIGRSVSVFFFASLYHSFICLCGRFRMKEVQHLPWEFTFSLRLAFFPADPSCPIQRH
jgi:hypothetical protein